MGCVEVVNINWLLPGVKDDGVGRWTPSIGLLYQIASVTNMRGESKGERVGAGGWIKWKPGQRCGKLVELKDQVWGREYWVNE